MSDAQYKIFIIGKRGGTRHEPAKRAFPRSHVPAWERTKDAPRPFIP